MNTESIEMFHEKIKKWSDEVGLSFEKREAFFHKNPSVFLPDEIVIYLKATHNSFFCNKQLIPITLTSDPFITNTNLHNDEKSLQNELDKFGWFIYHFTEEFQKYREKKVSECEGQVNVSDPTYFE